jgi:outer membrane lipoprotein SlyB
MTQEFPMNIRLIGAAALVAALATAGCATTSPGYGSGYGSGSGYGNAPASCYDCGTVTRIEQGSGSRVPNATGAVIGGVLGAAAAREIAKDRTDSEGRQNTATVGGAVAGAAIGNAIQNRAGTGYNIYVRMQDGREIVVSQDDLGGIREGSYVEVRNGRAYQR